MVRLPGGPVDGDGVVGGGVDADDEAQQVSFERGVVVDAQCYVVVEDGDLGGYRGFGVFGFGEGEAEGFVGFAAFVVDGLHFDVEGLVGGAGREAHTAGEVLVVDVGGGGVGDGDGLCGDLRPLASERVIVKWATSPSVTSAASAVTVSAGRSSSSPMRPSPSLMAMVASS